MKSGDKASVPLKLKNGFTKNGSRNGFTWKGIDGNPMIAELHEGYKRNHNAGWKKNHKIINKCSTQKAGWQ